MRRDGIMKAKTQMELPFTWDVENKKGLCRYFGQKRQAKESMPSMITVKGELATTDMEKAKSSPADRILVVLTSLELLFLSFQLGAREEKSPTL